MSQIQHPGQWRLEHLQLLNWGTFSGLHSVDIARKGFLFTGESGSGKSSIVDAISAVLGSRSRTRFNAAAADGTTRGTDRSVLTYVRGAYKRGANELTGEITSQYLRGGATWSGIALRYSNGRDKHQTLIKLFHIKKGEQANSGVREACILAPEAVNLPELQGYAANGLKVRELKRDYPQWNVDTEHSRFERRFSRVLGLSGDRATLLLHKTQSAKSLDSLDTLFRNFMLDEPATFAKADAAVEQFTELSGAYESVVRARRQVEHLTPLREESHGYDRLLEQRTRVSTLSGHLEAFTHHWRTQLTHDALDDAKIALTTADATHGTAVQARMEAQRVLEEWRSLVDERGGEELRKIEQELRSEEQLLGVVSAAAGHLAAGLKRASFPVPDTADEFAELYHSAERLLEDATQEQHAANQRVEEATEHFVNLRGHMSVLSEDIAAARSSHSTMPRALLEARELICHSAGLQPGTLPFAGELLQVKDEFSEWTGAIERVLRPLSMTLLVPTAHEQAVIKAINENHLGARVVSEIAPARATDPERMPVDNSLVRRVDFKNGPMKRWLVAQLFERFNYPCVDTAAQLQQLSRGVTLAGQVKRSARRYEKDDRSKVNDRRNWLLGFDAADKLAALLDEAAALRTELDAAQTDLDAARAQVEKLSQQLSTAADICERSWQDIDVSAVKKRIDSLKSSHARLSADNLSLRDAERGLNEARSQARAADEAAEAAAAKYTRAQMLVEQITELERQAAQEVPADISEELHREFAAVRTQRKPTHDTVEAEARKAQKRLNDRLTEVQKQLGTLELSMAKRIAEFRHQWPDLAGDLTDQVTDRTGYVQLLGQLEADRLPEFEHRFFDMLRSQTQQNIAQLRELIQRAGREIRQRIEPINDSLLRSEFAPGRYLQIEVKDSRPPLANEFLRDLNRITSGALSPDEEPAQAEERFLLLARIMNMLASSESADRNWRRQCLDVRQHVRFTAVEVDADMAPIDYYDSGDGRSGGQKQKLIVFCLAAALRYQLTQEGDVPRYGSIVMDEAFDKADMNFARMALDIFTEFGFHMILATPMKLLRTIEDYVGGLALVTCRDSQDSRLAPATFSQAPTLSLKPPSDTEATGNHRAVAEWIGGWSQLSVPGVEVLWEVRRCRVPRCGGPLYSAAWALATSVDAGRRARVAGRTGGRPGAGRDHPEADSTSGGPRGRRLSAPRSGLALAHRASQLWTVAPSVAHSRHGLEVVRETSNADPRAVGRADRRGTHWVAYPTEAVSDALFGWLASSRGSARSQRAVTRAGLADPQPAAHLRGGEPADTSVAARPSRNDRPAWGRLRRTLDQRPALGGRAFRALLGRPGRGRAADSRGPAQQPEQGRLSAHGPRDARRPS